MRPFASVVFVLFAAVVCGCGGGDDLEEGRENRPDPEALLTAIWNMQTLDSYRVSLVTDRPEELFTSDIEAEADGDFRNTMEIAGKSDEGGDFIVEFLLLDDYFYYLCAPEDECEGWVRRPAPPYLPTFVHSFLLDVQSFPLAAASLAVANGFEYLGSEPGGLRYRATVNATLALREHQRTAYESRDITEFDIGEAAIECTASGGIGELPVSTCVRTEPAPTPVSFDDMFAELIEGADIESFPVSTIDAWVNEEDLLLTRVLMTTPNEDVEPRQFSGTLGGSSLDAAYSHFNQVELKPPDEFTVEER